MWYVCGEVYPLQVFLDRSDVQGIEDSGDPSACVLSVASFVV